MYKLAVVNLEGKCMEIKSNSLEGLKNTAKAYNKLGYSVEITKEITLFRIVNN